MRATAVAPEVRMLAIVCLVTAALLYAVAAAPVPSPRLMPIAVGFASTYLFVSMLLVVLARFVTFVHVLIVCGLLVAGISALTSQAATVEGTMVSSFALIYVGIYAASFFDRGRVLAVLTLMSAGMLAAFCANGLRHWPGVWLLLSITYSLTALVLERAVTRHRTASETDDLTGLLNRRGFFQAAALEHSVSRRLGLPLGLALIDLDDFKLINDKRGHASGDRLLASAAAAWLSTLREGELLGRYGGDEFILLLPEADPADIERKLDEFRLAHSITWSAGVTQWTPDEPLEDCIERADAHLYLLKMNKRPSDALHDTLS